jgi:pilus assembly protein Flp/PilA
MNWIPASTRRQIALGEDRMSDALLKLYAKFEAFRSGEEGQDLVEYGLLLTMISLALISGIGGIANAVNTTFSNISSSLA